LRTRLVLVCVACLGVVAAAPWVGGVPDGDAGAYILKQLRFPRVLMACLVGGTLGIVGAAYQTIFANPLAAPSTVGTTAGATLGALAAVVLGGALGGLPGGLPVLTVFAFAGALLMSGFVAALAASGRARVNDVLLAGIAVSLAAGALATGLQYSADELQLFTAVRWSLGHLPQTGYRGVVLVLPFVAATVAVLLVHTRALQALTTGEERAHSQGVNVPRVRGVVLIAGALGVAACVAWVGPIAFVGLIVPHMVRMGLGTSRRVLLPMSVVVGAAFLVACDLGARLMLPGRELPVGVLTAGLGAPVLVWLIARQRR
jgi:ABC-type Fe3+-siderophore transport system permease subunit